MTEEPVIRIDNVSKSFLSEEKPVAVLENVSFNVGKEFLCIVGPSGCGKSTLLRMSDGLDRPSQGNVYFHGKPVEGQTPMMGMVFQNFALIPLNILIENVEMGLALLKITEKYRLRSPENFIQDGGLNCLTSQNII